MSRRIRYGRRRCEDCGAVVTTNALGRRSHQISAECTAARTRRHELRQAEERRRAMLREQAPAEEATK